MAKLNILFVEDDQIIRTFLANKLRPYARVLESGNLEGGKSLLNSYAIDYAIIDLNLGQDSNEGLKLIKHCADKGIEVMVLTSQDDRGIISEAFAAGCTHYFTKMDIEENFESRLLPLLKAKSAMASEEFFKHKFVTRNVTLKEEIRQILNSGFPLDSKILFTGPTGCGKSSLARMIHETSCPDKPFVHVNLSELQENLIESELFGHVKGSFTGAVGDREGLFSQADGGTLFLDEIGTVPLTIQKKLLRVLEDRKFSKVGSSKMESFSCRLITATCDDLSRMIEEGKLRVDFFFRIKGREVRIPGLKDRREDILPLVENFLSHSPKKILLAPEAEQVLMQYDWNGNTRELKDLIDQLTQNSHGFIKGRDLPTHIQHNQSPSERTPEHQGLLTSEMINFVEERGLSELTDEIKRLFVARALKSSSGKINQVVRDLKISKSLLYRVQKDIQEPKSVQ